MEIHKSLKVSNRIVCSNIWLSMRHNIRRKLVCILFLLLLLISLVLLESTHRASKLGKVKENEMSVSVCKNDGICRNSTSFLKRQNYQKAKARANTQDKGRMQLTNYSKYHISKADELSYITLKPETAHALRSNGALTWMLRTVIARPYLLENPHLCSSVQDLKVLVMVYTAVSNFENRQAIRQTWANGLYYSNLGAVKVLFLLGQARDRYRNAQIRQEFAHHGDLLQGDFVDSYHNLTIKGVMGFKWITERCKNARFIVKVDDDVVINMFIFLTKYATNFPTKSKHITCRRVHKARIERGTHDKWYVKPKDFKNQEVYSPYCQGLMASFSNDVIPALYKSSLLTPFFWIEDVFLYGLVLNNIPGINYTHLTYGKDVIYGVNRAIRCIRWEKQCQYMAILIWNNAPTQMRTIWRFIVDKEKKGRDIKDKQSIKSRV